eukprot:1428085-Alexandrium_andersonii.AAC.1
MLAGMRPARREATPPGFGQLMGALAQGRRSAYGGAGDRAGQALRRRALTAPGRVERLRTQGEHCCHRWHKTRE